ncbi:MAG: acyltransferase [Chitinophagaceae bacterium]|nr:acyltransferase [Chitinophagaceae bacterium]
MQADNKQMPFLDGFRAYAILLVIWGHLFSKYVLAAQFGVTLFFFVSGFLITKLLIAEYQKSGTIDLKKFYIRRFLRLYPALTFMLIVTSLIIVTYGYKIVYQEILAGFFYYTNYYRIYFPSELPASNYPSPGLLWSLAVEEHYYLVFPLLFLLCFSFKNNRFIYLLAILLVVFPGMRIYTYLTATDMKLAIRKIYMLTHYRTDSILYGCLSALLIYGMNHAFYLKIIRSKLCLPFGLAFLVFIQIIPGNFFQNTLRFSFQGIVLAFIIPCFLFANKNNFGLKLLENKLSVFIGRLSYSLYLFHWVAMAFLNLYYPDKNLKWYLLFFALTILLSFTSYFLIEKPFLRLRKKFGSNAS